METKTPEDRDLTLTTFIAASEMRIGVLDYGIGLPLSQAELIRQIVEQTELATRSSDGTV